VSKPTEKLAERELASDKAHEELYELLVADAADRVLPAPAVDEQERGKEAA
jgi:hypothetical protein